ncbi:MAG: flagellar basal body-associated protein FliL [Bdellovibrionales bacterium]
MSNSQEEVSLEDIDKLLAEEDPEFAAGLEEVRTVETDSSVVIEASAIDETDTEGDVHGEDSPRLTVRERIRVKIAMLRARWLQFRLSLKARFFQFLKDALVFLKTKPKEYALYSVATTKVLAKKAATPLKSFAQASRWQQAGILFFALLVATAIAVLGANLKGIWIPSLTKPMVYSLADFADNVETFEPGDVEGFYSAFPQDRYEFLFEKFKVNLKRSSEHPNPMGAFELIVEVDSNDTAVELKQRQVELKDLLQRNLEEENFDDLASELGKNRLKGRLKKELNAKLTQGWAKEISFKTFILKP